MDYLLAPNQRRDTDEISPLPRKPQSIGLLLGIT